MYSRYVSSGYGNMNLNKDLDRSFASFDLNYGSIIPEDKNAIILEIGCGLGHFQDYLQRKGFTNRTAIDIGIEQIEYCRKRYEGEFLLIEDSDLYLLEHPRSFDTIVMNDVLEHLTKNEVVDILDSIAKALKPGGRIIIRTPNMAALFSGASRFGDYTHEGGFTERSIKQVLSTVGFSEVTCYSERNFVESRLRWPLFWAMSKMRNAFLKFMVFVERPGDRYPTIFTKNLIVTADNQPE